MRENHDREWTCHLVFAEVEEGYAAGSELHANDFSGHTFCFVNVLASLINGDTVGGAETWRCSQKQQRD
jgi:hypothetical protein